MVKAEGSGIVIKEVDKAIDDDVARSCGGDVTITLHNDMFAGLNISLATWAAKGGVGEEALSILANGSVVRGHAGELSA